MKWVLQSDRRIYKKYFTAKHFANPDLACCQALGSFSFHHSNSVCAGFHSVHPACTYEPQSLISKAELRIISHWSFRAPVRLMSLTFQCCTDYPSHDECQSNLRIKIYQLSPSVKQWTKGTHVHVIQQVISHLHSASPQEKGQHLQQMGEFLHSGSDKNTIILGMHY